MADKDKNPKKGEGADAPTPDLAAEAAEAAEQAQDAEGLVEAEGPDVETSISDADLSFLEEGANDLAAERLADLQRLQAEYVNYRNRVERDREASRLVVIADIVKSLLPVLDDLDRAEAHGDLVEGPITLIAQKFRSAIERTGVTRVGVKDEPFDHNIHEAVVQLPTPGAQSMTVADVIETGYQLGSRLLRPAKVAVAVPPEE
ncbi:MAG: grpE [Homoserinimonas sp.]|jgi:molecular chaperone GrpE|nr:grpE [Homoserinimonas sp.]